MAGDGEELRSYPADPLVGDEKRGVSRARRATVGVAEVGERSTLRAASERTRSWATVQWKTQLSRAGKEQAAQAGLCVGGRGALAQEEQSGMTLDGGQMSRAQRGGKNGGRGGVLGRAGPFEQRTGMQGRGPRCERASRCWTDETTEDVSWRRDIKAAPSLAALMRAPTQASTHAPTSRQVKSGSATATRSARSSVACIVSSIDARIRSGLQPRLLDRPRQRATPWRPALEWVVRIHDSTIAR